MRLKVQQAVFLALILLSVNVFAQSNNEPSDYSPHDVKISGYLQAQFQSASRAGITSFAGGDFPENNKNRFIIRRGRFKFDRVDKYTNIVFQLDATQDGVSLRDGFIQLKEPFFNTFTLTAGQFTEPFGYAPSYSSSAREFPERPRFYQTLIPSERDLGAMLSISPPGYKFFNYEIGLFNGSGTNARDYDQKKDLVSSLRFYKDSIYRSISLGLGLSYYNGYVRQGTKTIFSPSKIAGFRGFSATTDENILGQYARRRYRGFDLQVETDGVFGKTSIKTEYVSGQQAGLATAEDLPGPQASRSFTRQPDSDIYYRKFRAYYIWLVKEIPRTQLQFIASYDIYDPNTYIKGKEIGLAGTNTTSADIKYQNLGAGIVFYMTKEVKLVFYYDHPVSEKTSLTDFNKDLKDDVFTARIQYRF